VAIALAIAAGAAAVTALADTDAGGRAIAHAGRQPAPALAAAASTRDPLGTGNVGPFAFDRDDFDWDAAAFDGVPDFDAWPRRSRR
jgi:hypothetical protein